MKKQTLTRTTTHTKTAAAILTMVGIGSVLLIGAQLIENQLTQAAGFVGLYRTSAGITLNPQSPMSEIMVGGIDVWQPFAVYDVKNNSSVPLVIDRMTVAQVNPNGDNADIAAVGILQNGIAQGQNIFTSGTTGTRDIDFTDNPINVPPNATISLSLAAKLNGTISSAAVAGVWHGIPRSGHTPQLQLLNAHITANGLPVITNITSQVPSFAVLRNSRPVVTWHPLADHYLSNTEKDLYAFQIAADSAHSIAWKQVQFKLLASNAVTLSQFRLRVGATDEDLSKYGIVANCGGVIKDVIKGSADHSCSTITVYYKEGQERSESGSGSVYTLHATVSGAVPGQNVTLTFVRSNVAPMTGFLQKNGTAGYGINPTMDPLQPSRAIPSSFIWSDNSEVPHSSNTLDKGGSRDWTDEDYVHDMSQAQTLSI